MAEQRVDLIRTDSLDMSDHENSLGIAVMVFNAERWKLLNSQTFIRDAHIETLLFWRRSDSGRLKHEELRRQQAVENDEYERETFGSS